MKKILLIFCLVLSLNAANIQRAFATTPQLSVLLELLAPLKMVGLNYAPYPEDTRFMNPAVAKLSVYGGYMQGKEPNFEKLLAAKPQIVFFPEGISEKIISKYKKFNIITKVYPSFKFQDLRSTIISMGTDLGELKRAKKLVRFLDKSQAIMSKEYIKKPLRIYFAQGNDGLQSECGYKDQKARTLAKRDDLAYLLHAQNVIICEPFAKARVQVNYEKLLRLNPDAIFVREIALYKKLKSNNKGELGKLKAIKQGRFYLAPSSPSNWLQRPPSAMRIIGLPWGFSKLYPALLNERKLKSMIQEFYKDFAMPLSNKAYEELVLLK